MNEKKYTSISLYKFFYIEKVFSLKNKINNVLKGIDIKGIILVAPEGININISCLTSESISLVKSLKKVILLSIKDIKFSYTGKHIYRKLKIKVKKEILTTKNYTKINPLKKVGKYIQPNEWDNFIDNQDVIIVDTRNTYEVKLGTFKKAINPNCNDFSSILKWLKEKILVKNNKDKKIAMFCTGGIRCEKATSFAKYLGYENIYHLKGGILNYLSNLKTNSNWQGECFVFDDRVSLKKNLSIGSFELCHACRMPLNMEDKKSNFYIKGVSCPNCFGKKTKAQLKKYKMRQKQIKSYRSSAC